MYSGAPATAARAARAAAARAAAARAARATAAARAAARAAAAAAAAAGLEARSSRVPIAKDVKKSSTVRALENFLRRAADATRVTPHAHNTPPRAALQLRGSSSSSGRRIAARGPPPSPPPPPHRKPQSATGCERKVGQGPSRPYPDLKTPPREHFARASRTALRAPVWPSSYKEFDNRVSHRESPESLRGTHTRIGPPTPFPNRA